MRRFGLCLGIPLLVMWLAATSYTPSSLAQDGPKKMNEGDMPKVRTFAIGGDHLGVEVVRDGKRLPLDDDPAKELVDAALRKEKLKLLGVLRYGKDGEPLSYYVERAAK